MFEPEFIPIPEPIKKGATKKKYLFAILEIGQSFRVPNLAMNPPPELAEKAASSSQITTAVSAANKKYHGVKVFRYALIEDNYYFQVWRES